MEGYTTKEMKRLNYLISETDAVYHEAYLKLGLSDSEGQILYTICNNGDSCPLSEICRLSGISKQTVNSALRKLEREGLVYLETYVGRRKMVCLTEQGKVRAEQTVVRLIGIENGILDSWSGEELALYLKLTERYLEELRWQIRKL